MQILMSKKSLESQTLEWVINSEDIQRPLVRLPEMLPQIVFTRDEEHDNGGLLSDSDSPVASLPSS